MKNRLIRVFVLMIILLITFSAFNNLNQGNKIESQMKNKSDNLNLQVNNWVANGTVICTASFQQENPRMCSDGVGGAILAWMDYRSGTNYDIYAQRIDSTGTVQWTSNGTVICNEITDQQSLQICSDGAGGAILTWQDLRSGSDNNIYAQRINSTGNVQWTNNGVSICTAIDEQDSPQICSDGAGGAIITWQDWRIGSQWDIYAQRIDATGAVQWAPNGTVICTANKNQRLPQICCDGTGGAIITWWDIRGTNYDIYAQRINATGFVQWAANGTTVCIFSANQQYPELCSDGAGGAILAWQDSRNGITGWDIYAQRIDSTGAIQWVAGGIPICTANNTQNPPQLCNDGIGGAIITWYDQRSGDIDIYAQRVDSTGIVQWASNGTAICTANNTQAFLYLCSDNAGGAVITWEDQRNGSTERDIYAQWIDSAGVNQWAVNGIAISTASSSQRYPQVCNDGAGGAIFTWQDSRSGSGSDIYTQQVNIRGYATVPKINNWVANGTLICNASKLPQICSDGAGGAIITWINDTIYAQRIDSAGFVIWTTEELTPYYVNSYYQGLQICSDGAGGAIIAWCSYNDVVIPPSRTVYVQRINSTGFVQWTAGGIPVYIGGDQQEYPQVCSDGTGGAIITWRDFSMATADDIHAQRINSTGDILWGSGRSICNSINNQESPQICIDGTGGAIITWEDGRSGTYDIYAQRINPNGVAQWTNNGLAICTASNDQNNPQICSDGTGGAIITWQDRRSGTYDIFAQRISSTGTTQWTINGEPICTAGNIQQYPQICSDGIGGAILTWEDSRSSSNYDIYAQQVDSIGTAQWAANGTAICTATNSQLNPQIYTDGAGGAVLTWQDSRKGSTNQDIYVQRVDPNGIIQWAANGTAICTANNSQIYPQICNDGTGGAIITWQDSRRVPFDDVYIQRIGHTGLLDFTVEAPFTMSVSPSFWSNSYFFNISWSNPTDPSGIIGVFYKFNSPPTSKTNGTYVAGTDINSLIGITVPDDGIHTIYIWLQDGAGNVDFNNYNTTVLYLDTAIASPLDVSATPSSWTPTNAFNITWTNPSDLSGIIGMYYKLDAPPIYETNGTYVAGLNINNITGITVPSDGIHTIYIWLQDSAGNVDFNNYNTTVLYLDTAIVSPLDVSATPSSWTSTNAFNITWTNPSDLSGIIGMYYKMDAPPIYETNGTYVAGLNINNITDITVPSDGIHTIYIWLQDNAGNVGFNNYNTTVLYLDTAIASPLDVSATPSSWTPTNAFNITWTNPHDLTGIIGAYYKLDTKPISNIDGIYVSGVNITNLTGITVSDVGNHTIYIWLKDSTGNVDFTQYGTTTLYLSEKSRSIPFPSDFFIPMIGLIIVIFVLTKTRTKLSSKLQNNV